MVAGVIARELGLELYRVDRRAHRRRSGSARPRRTSAQVFDAAEDGQVMLLFDEADSLFAKRTEVKTSNDRYANLEVNYLLQRLDSVRGHRDPDDEPRRLDRSGVQAPPRRCACTFPFPDEEMRAQLWAAHVPPQVPIAGDARLRRRSRGASRSPAATSATRAARRVPRRAGRTPARPGRTSSARSARVPRDRQALDDGRLE